MGPAGLNEGEHHPQPFYFTHSEMDKAEQFCIWLFCLSLTSKVVSEETGM